MQTNAASLHTQRQATHPMDDFTTSDFSRGETRILKEMSRLLEVQAENLQLSSGILQFEEHITSTLSKVQKALGADVSDSIKPSHLLSASQVLSRVSRASECAAGLQSHSALLISQAETLQSEPHPPKHPRISFAAEQPHEVERTTTFGSQLTIPIERDCSNRSNSKGACDTRASSKQSERPSEVSAISMFNQFDLEGVKTDASDVEVSRPMFTRSWPKDLFPLPLAQSESGDAAVRHTTNAVQIPEEPKLQQWCVSDGGPCQQFLQRHMVIDPTSKRHLVYGLVTCLVLLHDLIIIPWLLAWEVNAMDGLNIIAWTTATFWLLDLILSFFTAIQEDGALQINLLMIARRYLHTWFVHDVVLLCSDWATLVILLVADSQGRNGESLRMLRAARLVRFIRILSMLRILKFFRIIEDFLDRVSAEGSRLAIKIFFILIVIAWVNHVICCTWFWLGRAAPTDTGLRWSDSLFHLVLSEQTLKYQYWLSLHWSVAQITLGSMNVSCLNSLEHAFNIICLMFGLLFGSTLISSLSATMVQFQMMRNGRAQKLQTLRRYMQDNAVDVHISCLVQKQVHERLRTKQRLTNHDVPELALITKSLYTELQYDIYFRHVSLHPLYSLWHRMDLRTFKRFCEEALQTRLVTQSDELFQAGHVAQAQAYLVIKGNLMYEQDAQTSPSHQCFAETVEYGDMMVEAALWSQWIHVGRAVATSYCRVLEIHAKRMEEVLSVMSTAAVLVRQYARSFHRRLTAALPPRTDFPNDLHVPCTDFEDIVVAMDMDLQIAIGLGALSVLQEKRWKVRRAALADLQVEVEAGKSVIMINPSGEVQRLVAVVALKVIGEDGKVLVQLGKLEKSKLLFTGQLPGAKQQRGELASETVQRVLETKLASFMRCIEFAGMTRSSEEKESKQFGVRTKYLRTVCGAFLNSSRFAAALAQDSTIKICTIPESDVIQSVLQATAAATASPTASVHTQGGSKKPDAYARLSATSTASYLSVAHKKLSLVEHDIYVIAEDSENQSFYTWLTEDDFFGISAEEEGVLFFLRLLLAKNKTDQEEGAGSPHVHVSYIEGHDLDHKNAQAGFDYELEL